MTLKFALILIIIYMFGILMYYFFSLFYSNKTIKSQKIDYILILGSSLINDQITPFLKERLDLGIKMKNDNTIFVLSGGITRGNTMSESMCMKAYLLLNNIDNDHILIEEHSQNTVENISNIVQQIIFKTNNVLLITSDYHIVRAYLICILSKFKVYPLGSKSNWRFFLKRIYKEYNKCISLVIRSIVLKGR